MILIIGLRLHGLEPKSDSQETGHLGQRQVQV